MDASVVRSGVEQPLQRWVEVGHAGVVPLRGAALRFAGGQPAMSAAGASSRGGHAGG
jgi:hypothetical protein